LKGNCAKLCRTYISTRFIIDCECVCFVGIYIIFRGFRVIVKKAYLLSVHLSAYVSAAPTAWIFMKFYVGDFYENLEEFKID